MRKYIKAAAITLVLLLFLALIFSSCGKNSEIVIPARDVVTPENAGEKYHTSLESGLKKVVSGSFTDLYIDTGTFSVSVLDKTGDILWSALPSSKNNASYLYSLTLYTENGVYSLNTQDNSIPFGGASYEVSDNALLVDYILSDKKETIRKKYENITKDDVFASFSVKYEIYEQSLKAEIDLGSLKCTPGGFIGEIAFMPYFDSSDKSADDYIFIPDGSGAIMKDGESGEYTVKMYNEDAFMSNVSSSAGAIMPVYGIKRGDGAFSAIITEGDALASVKTSRSLACPYLGAYFTVTPVYNDENSGVIKSGPGYSDKIAVTYKFLSGSNANYIGMASAAREEFIKEGLLSPNLKEDSGRFPVYILVYAENAYGETLTTSKQVEDILSSVKSKGLDDVNVIFKGFLKGGLSNKNLYKTSISKQSGGENGVSDLYDYLKRLNYDFILDVNIMSSGKKYSGSSAQKSITGENAFYVSKNPLGYDENANNRLLSRTGAEAFNEGKSKTNPAVYGDNSPFNMFLLNVNKLPGKFSSFLKKGLNGLSDGYGIDDAGRVLYSGGDFTRQDAENTVREEVKDIINYGDLYVSSGNVYTLYGASYVYDMMFDSFYPESENYAPVPFAEAVLHGSLQYSGEPIDAGDPLYKYDMLQYIEYGASPYFNFVFDEKSIYCYNGYINSDGFSEIFDFYNDAKNALSDLSDDVITGHEKITKDANGKDISGVWKTAYSDGSEIYVNYTGSAVTTLENIVVGPYDFVKVKY